MTNTSYIWGCYHTITNHAIYIHRGTTSTIYFICKSWQTRQAQYQETLEAVGDKGQRIKKVTKVDKSKQCMNRGLQEEPVGYGVSMPSPQVTQQAASVETSPMPLKCFHHVLLLLNNIKIVSELQKFWSLFLMILTSLHSNQMSSALTMDICSGLMTKIIMFCQSGLLLPEEFHTHGGTIFLVTGFSTR